MARVYLVRHAESTLNAEGLALGASDPPLSDAGRRQAAALASRLAPVPFAAAYASDLGRALATAEVILGGRGFHAEPVDALREISYGLLEGLSPDEAARRHPDVYDRVMQADQRFAPPGGESVVELMARVRPVVARLLVAHASHDDDVLVVGHAGSLRALLICLLDLPADRFWRFDVALASLSVVRLYPDTSVLECWNDTSHLATAPGED